MSINQYLVQNRGKLAVAMIVLFFVPAFLWTFLTQVQRPESSISIERSSAVGDDTDTSLRNRSKPAPSDAAVKSNSPAPLGPVASNRNDIEEATTAELEETNVTIDKITNPFASPFKKAEDPANVFDVTKFFQRNIDDSAFDASELQDAVVETSAIVEDIVDEDTPVEERFDDSEDKAVTNSKEPVSSGVSLLAEVVESVQPASTDSEEKKQETTLLPSEDKEDEDDDYSQTSVLTSEKTEDTILEEVPGNTAAESETEEPLPTSTSTEEEAEVSELEVTTTLEVVDGEATDDFIGYPELFD